MTTKERFAIDEGTELRVSRVGVVLSVVLLVGLIAYTAWHLEDARELAAVLERAEPWWLLAIALFQAGTYVCAGAVWWGVVASGGHRLSLGQTARLAVEKLSVDHFVPTGGLSGNLVVVTVMRRQAVPTPLAVEALLVDILGFYASYGVCAVAAVIALGLGHDVPQTVLTLVGLLAVVLATVPAGIALLLGGRHWQPRWRGWRRIKLLAKARDTVTEAIRGVEIKRVLDVKLLILSFALHLAVFLLDAASFIAACYAVGAEVDPLTGYVALMVGLMAATLSFLPGGVGSFEAGAASVLHLLGTPIEVALMATLLFRGFSLWLPLLPGFLLARRDLLAARQEPEPAPAAA